MKLPLKLGEVYRDGNGATVVMVGEHPWTGLYLGAMVDGTVRKYNPATGQPQVCYGDGVIRAHVDKKEPGSKEPGRRPTRFTKKGGTGKVGLSQQWVYRLLGIKIQARLGNYSPLSDV